MTASGTKEPCRDWIWSDAIAGGRDWEQWIKFFLPNQVFWKYPVPSLRPACERCGWLVRKVSPPCSREDRTQSLSTGTHRRGWSDPMKKSIASLAALFLCVAATATFAQGPGDIINRIENFVHSAVAKAAQSRWSKLPETEYACVNQKLQERGDSLPSLIERGVFPSDRRVAKVRSQCHGASAPQQFQKLDHRAYRRSGQDTVITASNYHDCENACSQSSSCAALTYFRAERMCRMMQSTTELDTDEGAVSAIRIESITGSVAPQTPRPE
jgi:hypothetical protein